MPLFHVRFPERVVNPTELPNDGCGMAGCHICTPASVKRGVSTLVEASDKREAWDRMHRMYPFERVEVE